MQQRMEAIGSELDNVRELFTDEEVEAFCDSEKDNVLDKAAVKAALKTKDEVEPSTKKKLKQLIELWNEQSKTNKEIKIAKQQLEDSTVQAINNLTDDEVNHFLHLKWILPVCSEINDAFHAIITNLEADVLALSNKYGLSLKQINHDCRENNNQLAQLVKQLTGDEWAIEGLTSLFRE